MNTSIQIARDDVTAEMKPAAGGFFYSSTPAFRPDWCDSVGRWRCTDKEAAADWARTIEPTAYVVPDGSTKGGVQKLVFGRRDSGDCTALLTALKGLGYKARSQRFGSRQCAGVTVYDATKRADA